MKDITTPIEINKPRTKEYWVNAIIRFEEWTEKNKQDFIRKYNPELFEKMYGKK